MAPNRSAAPQRLRVRRPADILSVVPYLLGFHPAEAVVVLLLRRGEVALTARLDLPPPAEADVLAGYLTSLAAGHQADGVITVTYSNVREPAMALGAVLGERLEPAGLVEALYADGTRWWSLRCPKECCPAEGTPYDASCHPLAAEAVYAGRSALPNREALAELTAGPGPEEVEALSVLADGVLARLEPGLPERRAQMARLVRNYLAAPRPLSNEECLRLAALAADVHVRDVAWGLMTRPAGEQHLDLWRQVVATAVAPLESAPLCLLGMAAWIVGNGALLNCCLERVELLDPAYTMAGLLSDITSRAIPPQLWDELGAQIRAQCGFVAEEEDAPLG